MTCRVASRLLNWGSRRGIEQGQDGQRVMESRSRQWTADRKANMETPLHKSAGCEFRVSSFESRQTEPNKPNGANTFVVNGMTEKWAKQTQRTYRVCYQSATAILTRNFGKFGWNGRGSLSGIRAAPRGPALQTNAGLKPGTGVVGSNLPANLRCALE